MTSGLRCEETGREKRQMWPGGHNGEGSQRRDDQGSQRSREQGGETCLQHGDGHSQSPYAEQHREQHGPLQQWPLQSASETGGEDQQWRRRPGCEHHRKDPGTPSQHDRLVSVPYVGDVGAEHRSAHETYSNQHQMRQHKQHPWQHHTQQYATATKKMSAL
eukprot:TRINITY_DN546_c0_g1_i4.p2 TRINITY_DN546_c0_g1~~TRINITY_DN546_c0_g1_i4.p2  ORF type:complete len:161 (-),score=13.90 TRINITY_DN546_c0_g1_i4:290-772(-)